MNTKKLALSGLFVAAGTLLGSLVSFPVGFARCFPIQHSLNVLAAVILGPGPAVLNAFAISLLRNLLGSGSLLAFPGSIPGALLAALFYKYTKNRWLAGAGEITGTALIGSLLSYPLALFVMGKEVTAWFVLMPFLISTVGGTIIAWMVLKALEQTSLKWQQH